MILKAGIDSYGNVEHLTSNKLRHIIDLIDEYMGEIPYTIHEIRQENVYDPYGRIDIEIRYADKNNSLIEQKLLILDV